ncbi:MAG: DUF4286 family protein [Bacteroidota bacterium]
MILYNVTIKLDDAIKADWLEWMQSVHIPDVMATGLFKEYKLSRLIGDEDEYGTTFAIQYLCGSMDDFETYQASHAAALQADHTERYKGKFGAFRTLLEVLSAS